MDIETGDCPSVLATKGIKHVSVRFSFVGYYLLTLYIENNKQINKNSTTQSEELKLMSYLKHFRYIFFNYVI